MTDYWTNRDTDGLPPTRRGARPARPPDYVSERKARLTLTCLGASFVVLVIGLVVFFTVRTLRQTDAGTVAANDEGAARVVGGIGPAPGADVPTYIKDRKKALADATGDRFAVVSLKEYTTEGQARALVGSTEVVALLAAAPGGQPSVVTGDLAAWVDAQTAQSRAERDEIQRLIPTVQDDPGFEEFYRSEVERLDKVIRSIRPDGDLVFGAVVRAPAGALQELGRKPEVRLVDVSEGPDRAPKPDYRGLRPEETSRANDPNTRPA